MAAPYPDHIKARALELLAAGESIAGTRKTLAAEHPGERVPASATLKAWCTAAGIDRSVRPQRGAAAGAATPEKALEARLARQAEERRDLSELILTKLSRNAADLLARRLARALEAEELVDLAAQRWADCLKLERMAVEEQMGREAVREAKAATAAASDDLAVAHRLAIGTRDLVGILTRSVVDHLALAGVDAEDRDTGDLIVELLIPEPVPDDAAVADEDDLERTDAA